MRSLLLALVLALPCGAQGLPPRDSYQRVPDIIAALGDVQGKRIADVAAGKGYLTKPLARAVGAGGRVFAVEIDEESLAALRVLARDSLQNLEVIASTATDPKLPSSIDGVVILNSYHELSDYRAILAAIRSALKPGAMLVLVDNVAGGFGGFVTREDQASHHAIDAKFVVDELRAAGFEIVKRQDDFIVQPFPQWLIVARR
jgi:predicted methyltransferase